MSKSTSAPLIRDVADFLKDFAPPSLAEEWDNVGLLVGDDALPARRIMTCLSVYPAVAEEAIAKRADLIVSHHPFPFQAIKRITTSSLDGALLWRLIGAGVSVYSPHTGFDSAAEGINAQLARGLELQNIRPLAPIKGRPSDGLGAGRLGEMPAGSALAGLIAKVKRFLRVEAVQVVGAPDRPVKTVAVACGSGGSFLSAAAQAGADALVTGEARFHSCLEAEWRGVALVLPGHFASERFALDDLAQRLQAKFPDAVVWASEAESDPLRWA
ncbi:MAG TPA: Nif3-like dinuclear metal center hexameric protein [Pirellulales bacterium]